MLFFFLLFVLSFAPFPGIYRSFHIQAQCLSSTLTYNLDEFSQIDQCLLEYK